MAFPRRIMDFITELIGIRSCPKGQQSGREAGSLEIDWLSLTSSPNSPSPFEIWPTCPAELLTLVNYCFGCTGLWHIVLHCMEGSVDAEGVCNYTLQMLLPHHKLQPLCTSVKWGIVTFLTFNPLMIYLWVANSLWIFIFFFPHACWFILNHLVVHILFPSIVSHMGILAWCFYIPQILIEHIIVGMQDWL